MTEAKRAFGKQQCCRSLVAQCKGFNAIDMSLPLAATLVIITVIVGVVPLVVSAVQHGLNGGLKVWSSLQCTRGTLDCGVQWSRVSQHHHYTHARAALGCSTHLAQTVGHTHRHHACHTQQTHTHRRPACHTRCVSRGCAVVAAAWCPPLTGQWGR